MFVQSQPQNSQPKIPVWTINKRISGSKKIIKKQLNPFGKHLKQAEFVSDSARYTWVESGTKAGKTQGMIFWLISEALKKDSKDKEFWWIAPVYKQAKIAFRRTKRRLGKGLIKSTTNSPMRINLINDSAIEFQSAEKPDNLYGEDVYAAVLDECSRMREEAWFAVRSTLTATNGPAKLIGNVKGRKNWFYQWSRKAEAGEPNHSYYKLTSADNPYISKEEIEDAKRVLPEEVFNELYLAIPSNDQGNPFGFGAINNCIAPKTENPVVCWGVDLGKRVDWTVLIGLDVNGQVSTFYRFQKPWREVQKDIIDIVGHAPTLVDSTGVGDPVVEEIQAKCNNVEGYWFTPKSKQQLMEGLQVDIHNGSTSFPKGVISNELESFEYEYTRTGAIYSAPDGMHDDCVCALALARHKFRELKISPQLHLSTTIATTGNSYARPTF